MSASHRLTQEGLARKQQERPVVEAVFPDVIEFEPETEDDWGDGDVELLQP